MLVIFHLKKRIIFDFVVLHPFHRGSVASKLNPLRYFDVLKRGTVIFWSGLDFLADFEIVKVLFPRGLQATDLSLPSLLIFILRVFMYVAPIL